jgi:hypothetical protein
MDTDDERVPIIIPAPKQPAERFAMLCLAYPCLSVVELRSSGLIRSGS